MGEHIPLPADSVERDIELRRRRNDRKAIRRGQLTRQAREHIAKVKAARKANLDLIGGA